MTATYQPARTTDLSDLVTVRDAARRLGLSPVTIRRAVREGRLRSRRIGAGKWTVILVESVSIEEYRDTYLGRRGPVTDRCLTCGYFDGDPHAEQTHEFVPDPRRKVA